MIFKWNLDFVTHFLNITIVGSEKAFASTPKSYKTNHMWLFWKKKYFPQIFYKHHKSRNLCPIVSKLGIHRWDKARQDIKFCLSG